jgi:hypothetical protein
MILGKTCSITMSLSNPGLKSKCAHRLGTVIMLGCTVSDGGPLPIVVVMLVLCNC